MADGCGVNVAVGAGLGVLGAAGAGADWLHALRDNKMRSRGTYLFMVFLGTDDLGMLFQLYLPLAFQEACHGGRSAAGRGAGRFFASEVPSWCNVSPIIVCLRSGEQ